MNQIIRNSFDKAIEELQKGQWLMCPINVVTRSGYTDVNHLQSYHKDKSFSIKNGSIIIHA